MNQETNNQGLVGQGFIVRTIDILITLAVIALLLLTALNVLLRYFNRPITASLELSSLLFVWLTFLGAIKLTALSRHLRVSFLLERLGRGRPWVEVLDHLLVLVFAAAVMIKSGPVLRSASKMQFATLPWAASSLWYAVPVGFAGIALYEALEILHYFRGRRWGRAADGEERAP